eukprot:GFUD01009723.1.p1 GENE.GFUD01009723.1~~GFUD01009723.1.p1  ORF type:complete len:266 (-),score=80.15 GFUD01009723.1:140-937(-)
MSELSNLTTLNNSSELLACYNPPSSLSLSVRFDGTKDQNNTAAIIIIFIGILIVFIIVVPMVVHNVRRVIKINERLDWLTVCGATIADLELAWLHDYRKETRPMRICLSAGLHDLARGRTRAEIVESILHFKRTVDQQNQFHPHTHNQFLVATILNPPKFVWFPENEQPPPNHTNMLQEIAELNDWIVLFTQQQHKETPRSKPGVKNGGRIQNDRLVRVPSRHFNQWRQAEPVLDMLNISDVRRVRLGMEFTMGTSRVRWKGTFV